jgi:hypothetical protein
LGVERKGRCHNGLVDFFEVAVASEKWGTSRFSVENARRATLLIVGRRIVIIGARMGGVTIGGPTRSS